MTVIFEVGGKQYKANEGNFIYVENLNKKEKEKITFDKIIAVDDKFGAPYLKDASVVCSLVKNGKQKKLLIIKHKRYTRSIKRKGHRQLYSKLLVEKINFKK